MTKRQAEKLLREWQTALRLQDWNVSLELQPGAEYEGNAAAIWRDADMLHAILRLAREQSDADIEGCIIHELCHLLLADVQASHIRAIDKLPKAARESSRHELKCHEEQAVRRLEECIVKLAQAARKSKQAGAEDGKA